MEPTTQEQYNPWINGTLEYFSEQIISSSSFDIPVRGELFARQFLFFEGGGGGWGVG
jgi:hypothetical protein